MAMPDAQRNSAPRPEPERSARPAWSFDPSRAYWLVQLVLFFSIVAPVIFVAILGYRWTERRLTEEALTQRQAIAYTAAATLRGRFDRYSGIAKAFASHEGFSTAVAEGRWDDVVKMLSSIPQEFTSVDSAFLADVTGRVVADVAEPGNPGADLSGDDWFKGVRSGWRPYVSTIYERPTQPPLKVFAVAVPVKGPGGDVSGILVLEMRTEALLDWARAIDVGPSGYAYFVDRNGELAAHPKYPAQGPHVSFADVPAVQRLQQGRGGVGIAPDGPGSEEMIVAYEPIREYGWGAVVSQPTASAFAPRSEYLAFIFYVFGVIISVNMLLALGIMRMARAANEAYQREKAFLDAAGDGMVATDAKGVVVMVNPQGEKMLGWTSDELCGKTFVETIPMEDETGAPVPLTFRPLIYALKVGQRKATTTTPTNYFVRKDKSRFPAAETVTPLFKEGKVAGAVAVFRDITVEKEIDRAKSEFVSLASHQLLSPLSAVKGYTYMMNDGDLGKLTTEQKRVVGSVIQIVERMVSLVNALLNVSRIELGTFAVVPEPTDVTTIAENIVFELGSQIEKKNISLAKLFDMGIPVINADPNLLRIVFQNLLTNAVRYSPMAGKINLSIEKRPTMLLVTVSDEGIGIPRDQQAKIFNKFFRANNARKTVLDGNGMGLYVTKAILDHTEGKIWFTSVEGKGTTFYVTLPLKGMGAREGSKSLTYSE